MVQPRSRKLRRQIGTDTEPSGKWKEGSEVWVWSKDGEHFRGIIVEGPWICSNGAWMVMVAESDGNQWETKIKDLRTSNPSKKNEFGFYIPALTKKKKLEQVMPTIKPKRLKTISKTTETEELCHCGCGGKLKPKRNFLQGHDARFHSRVKKLKAGIITMADLKKEVQPYAVKYYSDGGTKAAPKRKRGRPSSK